MWLRERGRAGVFLNGFLSLGFGSLVAAFHDVWTGPAAILTVLAWILVAKGLLCFVLPRTALRSLAVVSPERAWQFVVPGAGFLLLGAWLVYAVFLRLMSRI